MTSVIPEKLGYAEIEARKRRERLLRLKRKAQGQLDDEEEVQNIEENESTVPAADLQPEKTDQPGSQQADELDLSNLAPRKIDWDLKRGIAKSLEILQERTREVIEEIVREQSEMKDENDPD